MKPYLYLSLPLVLLTACAAKEASFSSTKLSETTNQVTDINWSQAGPDAKKYKMTFGAVKQAVANGAKFYDVRSEEEYKESNFGITTNFPLTELSAGKFPGLDRDTPIYVHCLKGIRSAQATKILREAGFTHVYDLGGLEHVKAIGGQLVQS